MREGDSYGGQGLHLLPLKEHTSTVIWMHGLGDTAHGWAPLFTNLQKLASDGGLPTVGTKFVLPTAPPRKITINGGVSMNAWADIYAFCPDAPEDEQGYCESRSRILKIIEGELRSGIPSERIVVGGFSQGGALAYLTGLTIPKDITKGRLGGVAACSAWLPMRNWINKNTNAEALQGLQILHCHGTSDDLIPVEAGQICSHLIKKVEPLIQFTFKEYKGMGHEACEEEQEDVHKFFSKFAVVN